MRRYAFVLAIFGIFVMVLLLSKKPVEVNNVEELKNFEVNTRVKVEGKVLQERNLYADVNLIKLNNGFELVCECEKGLVNKSISTIGKVEKYEEKKQIRVLEIWVLD